MRVLTMSMLAVVAAFAIAGCSNSNSGGSAGSTSTEASAAPAGGGEASTAPAAAGELPSYPGATTEAAGSNMSAGMGGTASGKVLSTTDDFDKVYAWYQKNMPAGSEKSHMDAPVKSAVFMVGDPGKDQQSVTISVAGSKTMITIAHVKM